MKLIAVLTQILTKWLWYHRNKDKDKPLNFTQYHMVSMHCFENIDENIKL